MFLENKANRDKRKGWIEVICGSMFSGKTEELIRRLRRARFASQKVEIFKPRIDTRYSVSEVVSHDANSIMSTPVDSSQTILLLTADVDVVGIDEAQFFDPGIVEVCNVLANQGIRVIVAGLDMDFKGKPFGPMPQLMQWQSMCQKFMPSAWCVVIWQTIRIVSRRRKNWWCWVRRMITNLFAEHAIIIKFK